MREKISKMKFIPEDKLEQFNEILEEINAQMAGILTAGGEAENEE